jgi:hypothetical protein
MMSSGRPGEASHLMPHGLKHQGASGANDNLWSVSINVFAVPCPYDRPLQPALP